MAIDRRRLFSAGLALPLAAGVSSCAASGQATFANVALLQEATKANDQALSTAERQRALLREAKASPELLAAADATVDAIRREREVLGELLQTPVRNGSC